MGGPWMSPCISNCFHPGETIASLLFGLPEPSFVSKNIKQRLPFWFVGFTSPHPEGPGTRMTKKTPLKIKIFEPPKVMEVDGLEDHFPNSKRVMAVGSSRSSSRVYTFGIGNPELPMTDSFATSDCIMVARVVDPNHLFFYPRTWKRCTLSVETIGCSSSMLEEGTQPNKKIRMI